MLRVRFSTLRKKLIPAAAILVVVLAIVASAELSAQKPNTAFAVGVYWPAPTAYVSSQPLPNFYLAINYTGPGLQDFTYSIVTNSTVLAHGTVPINHYSPFRVLAYAPVPSNVQAQVFEQGRLVYMQNLTLS